MKKNDKPRPHSLRRGAAFVLGLDTRIHKDRKKEADKNRCRCKETDN